LGPYIEDTMATHDIFDYLRFDICVVSSMAHKTLPHYSQMTRLHIGNTIDPDRLPLHCW
jgi:hypothetical protein